MKRTVVVLALLSAPVLATALRPFAGMRSDAPLGWNTATGSPSGVAAPPSPNFDLVAGSTTPNDLSDSLTVNGTAMTLVLGCDAQGISGTNWTCRDASGAVVLSEAGTGSSPTTTISTPFHALDSAERGVTFAAAGKYYEAATTSVGQIGAEDAVIEMVTRPGVCATTGAVMGTAATPGVGTAGWAVQRTSTSCRGQITVSDGTNTANSSATAINNVFDRYNHTIYAIDSGVGIAAPVVNAATPSTAASTALNLTSTGKFGIGTVAGGATAAVSIISIRIWKCANCITSIATDLPPIARARTAATFGVLPSIATGSSAPTSITRATTAMVDVVDGVTRHLYLAGVNAPRVARRSYSGGTIAAGFMSEPASTNLALQSQTLGTTWTAITVGDNVLADQWATPELSVTGDDVDGNNSLGEHGLRQSVTLTAATHTFSTWAKAGAQTFIVLRDNTIVNGAAWINVATCTSGTCSIGEDCVAALGTVQAGVIQARAQRWPVDSNGDGVADVNLCRASIAYTGTAAAHDHDLLCAPSDGVTTYTDADATADCGFWGARVEAFPTMTSYLATTTVSVTRNADDVRYDGTNNYIGSPTTMDTQVLCPSYDIATTSTFASIGTGTANFARLGIDPTADRMLADATVTTSQWSIIAASGDVSDGVLHSLRQTMATDSIQAYYDGVSIGTDNLATLPTAASSFIYLGTAGSTATQPMCLISRVRLWAALVTP
jgi:hypothetical protein